MSDEYNGVTISTGVVIVHEPTESGVTVIAKAAGRDVYEGDSSMDPKEFADSHDPDTWTPFHRRDNAARDYFTKQTYKEVANNIEDKCPDYLNSNLVAEEFRELCQRLSENADDVKRSMMPPVVDTVLRRTESVKYRPVGDEMEIIVSLSNGSKSGEITFSVADWLGPSPHDLKVGYFTIFHKKLEIDGDAWEHIRDVWDDQHEEVAGDTTTELETATEEVLEKLKRQYTPHDARQGISRGRDDGWYEEKPASRMTSINGDPEAVAWVRSTAFNHYIDDTPIPAGDLSKLINHMRDEGDILTECCRIDNRRVYGVNPDSIEFEEAELKTSDDDDDEYGEML